jgi:DNA-binding MarR family transcriptional regulator
MHDFGRFSRENGLSMPQMGALFNLYRKGKISISMICDDLGVTSAAASQMLDRLVQQGFLARSEDPDDRRVKQIILRPKGIAVIDAIIQLRRDWLETLTEMLTTEEQETVVTALDLLTDAARKLEPEEIME